jgi:hypothetical protein
MQPWIDRVRDAWKTLAASPNDEFPRGPAPNSSLAWRPWTLALLFLACLIPRAVAAWNWDLLWGDSLHYLHASLALEHGDLETGFNEFGLNLYPILLIPLRHLGIDWPIAGKYFGVLVASCTVLPLWGWLRRMFDDRLAAGACLIYALHGKLIAISPLIIRDSLFWFMLVLSLYYVWRAVGELRIGLFLAAGISLTLAIYTRTEGWLLLVPLLGWGICRWPTAGRQRTALAIGTLLCVAVIPAAVALTNFTWLHDNARWDFLRASHVRLAVRWWNAASGMHVPLPRQEITTAAPLENSPRRAPCEAMVAGEGQAAAASSTYFSIVLPTVASTEQSLPGWRLTFKLMELVAIACTWVGSLLLLVGLVSRWRIFLRPEHRTLLLMNLLLLLVSRIRYGTVVGVDLRYFMPLAIVALPWMALGLKRLLAGADLLLPQRASRSLSGALAAGLITLAVAGSFAQGPMAATAYMRKHSALGRWISDRVSPHATIAGNLDHFSLEVFYSQGLVVGTFEPGDCLLVPPPAVLAGRQAEVVVLWTEESMTPGCSTLISPEHRALIAQRIRDGCRYRQVDAKELPAGENELLVFMRDM